MSRRKRIPKFDFTIFCYGMVLVAMEVLLTGCSNSETPRKKDGRTQQEEFASLLTQPTAGYNYDNGTLSVMFPETPERLSGRGNPPIQNCETMIDGERVVFGLCDEVSTAEKSQVRQFGFEQCYTLKPESLRDDQKIFRQKNFRVSGQPAIEWVIGPKDGNPKGRYEITHWIYAANRNEVFMLRVVANSKKSADTQAVHKFFDSVKIR